MAVAGMLLVWMCVAVLQEVAPAGRRGARAVARPGPSPSVSSLDGSIGGVTVPFFMYPGMANVTSRLLDCLSFGTGLDADDAAATEAWFRGARMGPVSQFLTDTAMFAQMEVSTWRTEDPEAAVLFYVPLTFDVYGFGGDTGSCLASSAGLPAGTAPREARERIFAQALDEMESMPYARRRRGADHVWTMIRVDTHSSPQQLPEELFAAIERGVHLSKRWFRGLEREAACQVMVPMYASSLAPKVRLDVWPRTASRAKLLHGAYFRGHVDVHHTIYREVRLRLMRIAEALPEYGWSVTDSQRSAGGKSCANRLCSDEELREAGLLPELMMSEMSRSTFCLVPGGDMPDTQRLSIAVIVDCIPVVIARIYGDGGAKDGKPSKKLRREYISAYEATGVVSTRQDFVFYTPFPDVIDYSSFAVLVDPVEFLNQPDTWLPDRLAAIAANATLVDAMLLSLARAARHLVYDEVGSDVGNVALLAASRHCLTRPTDRLPTERERAAVNAAGVSWAADDRLRRYLKDSLYSQVA